MTDEEALQRLKELLEHWSMNTMKKQAGKLAVKPKGRGASYRADERLVWLADILRRRLKPGLSKQEALRRVTALHRLALGPVWPGTTTPPPRAACATSSRSPASAPVPTVWR